MPRIVEIGGLSIAYATPRGPATETPTNLAGPYTRPVTLETVLKIVHNVHEVTLVALTQMRSKSV